MLSSAQYANGRYAEAIETLSPLVGARDTMAFRFFAQQITLQNLIYHTFAETGAPGSCSKSGRASTCTNCGQPR